MYDGCQFNGNVSKSATEAKHLISSNILRSAKDRKFSLNLGPKMLCFVHKWKVESANQTKHRCIVPQTTNQRERAVFSFFFRLLQRPIPKKKHVPIEYLSLLNNGPFLKKWNSRLNCCLKEFRSPLLELELICILDHNRSRRACRHRSPPLLVAAFQLYFISFGRKESAEHPLG